MTRKEYMETLKEKLAFMAEDARQGILDYYAEMLEDRMEDGQSEEAAVAAMESPEEIAARIAQEQGKAESEIPLELENEAARFASMVDSALESAKKAIDEDEKEKERRAKKAVEIDGANADVNGIVNSVLDTVCSALGEAGKAVDQVMDKITEKTAAHAQYAEKAARAAEDKSEKFVDAVYDWTEEKTFGEYEKKTFVCPADQLRAVRLHAGEMPFRVLGTDGDEAVLTYYTCDDDPYEAGVQDGTLFLQRLQRPITAGRLKVMMFGGIVRLWSKSSPTVELSLPRAALVDLYCRTTNASIKAEALDALCNVELKSSNGRIVLKDIACKDLNSVTSNGRQVLENVRCKQGFRVATSNGRIEGRGLLGERDIVLTTSNGRVVMEDSRAKDAISLTSSNGAVEIWRSDAASVTLRTSNSSIRGELPGPQSVWAIQSGTSNGHNSLPREQAGEKPLHVRTSNGSIDLHFS
ncbi:MAG: DUF4097 family beta strand repeat protein [Clostridia bacterium]|nr:DUF4097 family beta strand repeat protein [Clostridia bacterium]MBR6186437.1 DUF4097 family beta strand repeat protein [Clostridia bacterium]